MSHAYFRNKNVDQQEIRDFIGRMKVVFPGENLDEALLFRKLESIHSIRIGLADTLDDATDHVEWFNPSTGEGYDRKISWHFWTHYMEYVTLIKGWPKIIVNSMDSLSSQIFSRLEDPERPGPWDRRGMVMGSVQSGKTANYTAVITKAADAGYKLIVVLAGIHDSLRSQTQTRLNEEFLGYDIDRVQKLTGGEKKIGVRALFPEHNTVYTLTSSSQKGDFSKLIASQSGIFPSKDGPPIILVIKKNVSILGNLIAWIPSVIGQIDADGNRVIKDIPLLLIDDECDFASINTKEPERDNEGKIVEEWDPTKTNRLIRQLLKLFEKSAYIGYTATPYANVFIDMEDTHPTYGEDLFPRSFIISLPQPSNYLGPERIFGLDEDPNRDIEAVEPLPLVRLVEDHSENIPDAHPPTLIVNELPDSLKRAIKCFLLTCAARKLRFEGIPHNSMIVHVTRYTAVQQQIKMLIDKELIALVSRIMSMDELADFREIWESDFLPTSEWMSELGFKDAMTHDWIEIVRSLGEVARMVTVKMINNTVRDVLDYKDIEIEANNRRISGEEVPWEERGLNVIAIGGDKFSRGLTLEGLSISYYLRAAGYYDTLMQMGRWFGFRDGYSDLCRIFTTDLIMSWYRYIAVATQELREEIEYMSALKLTPSKFGMKIRSHPGRLAVTSLSKSRNKQKVPLSYAGEIEETVVFDPRHSSNNLKALEKLITDIGKRPDKHYEGTGRLHWTEVPSEKVIAFLGKYRTQDLAKKVVDPEGIARYIEKQNVREELIRWDVVILSKDSKSSDGNNGNRTVTIAGYELRCNTRKANSISNEKISIQRLVSPADEVLDLSEDELVRARQFDRARGKDISDNENPWGIAIRHVRPKDRGLLLIYFLSGHDDAGNEYGVAGQETIGFAISFPHSTTAEPIEYWVNPIYQDEEAHYI